MNIHKLSTVVNRSGKTEKMEITKIIGRLEDLCTNPFYGKELKNVDILAVAIDTIKSIYEGISTKLLDEQSCRIALGKIFVHAEYEKLASRIVISDHLKSIEQMGADTVSGYVAALKGVISETYSECLLANEEFFEKLRNKHNNFRYSFKGFYTLKEGNYLLKKLGTKVVVESPDMATIRVATALAATGKIQLAEHDKALIIEIYNGLSSGYYTHATPVLLNSGTPFPQYASCFVMKIDDSLDSIMTHKYISAMCQKYSGGVGESWGALRAKGSVIKGTNGVASGLRPLAKLTDELGYYIDQGGGKRPGSISPYVPDYHPDLLSVLELRKVEDTKQALEGHRLYYAIWISGYFLECVMADEDWYFICPSVAPELNEVFGEEFKAAYLKAIPKARGSIKARELMKLILVVQANAGVPYIVNRDNINAMRNQPVPIYSSNLCTEITVPANKDEVGVCNLASVSIVRFVEKSENGEYLNRLNGKRYTINEGLLEKYIRLIVRSIDSTIDNGFYPVEQCRYSNQLRRPIGIGVMGLADALCKMAMVFGSQEAICFRARFEELMTYYAYDESIELAKTLGPIKNWKDYKQGQGILHPVAWAKNWSLKCPFTKNWDELALKAKEFGVRHSVMRANMPTGNVAITMGNSPCFEPYESNIYKISAFSMDLVVVNKYLRKVLESYDMMTPKFINRFTMLSGSIQDLNFRAFTSNPQAIENEALIKKIYRAASFEISPYEIVDMAAAAQPFVDQSQSMNLWFPAINMNVFNIYYYGYKSGLKSLCYYVKTSSATKKNVCTNCVI